MISPQRIAEIMTSQIQHTDDLMIVYWIYCPDGDRAVYASTLESACEPYTVIAVVPRQASMFTSPNALHDDIRRMLEIERSHFEIQCKEKSPPYALALVMRSPCEMSQISSPLTLPDWFPHKAGQITYVKVIDPLRRVKVTLDADELSIADLGIALYELETALVRALRVQLQESPDATQALLRELIAATAKKGAVENPEDVITKASKYLESIDTPDAFRPSVRDAAALISRLQAVTSRTALDGMGKVGRLLADGLGLSFNALAHLESIFAIAFRPLSRDPDPISRIGRAILLNIYAALQLITASHHAADYPRYSAVLLSSVGSELLNSLRAITAVLSA